MSDFQFQAPTPEHLAELLPQFDIEFFIAQGGMGAVYKGRQRSLDRDIAIKVLPKELGANEEFRESFNTEAKAMARLNHPNLLGVFDFGTVDGMPYIVMEYVEGGSLYEACFEQAVDPEQAVSIVKGICDGLANAHMQDIVHRDIKPANILLTEKIVAKVADFGLAQALDSDQPGLVMGTPGYTAPEVFQDPDQAGKLADIYSVGVILHQLLTGIDPSGSMEPPTKPSGNLRLDAIWRKATNPVPTQRYPTVDAMANDLEKWASSFRPKAAAGAAAAYRPPSRPVKVSSGGGGGTGFKILLIAVLAGVVVVTYQVLQKQKGEIEKINAEIKSKPKVKVVRVETNPDEGEKPDSNPPDLAGNDPDPIETVISLPDPEPPAIVDVNPVDEGPATEPELEPGDLDLRKKATELILGARSKRDAELTENVRGFVFQLGIHSRSVEFGEKDAIEELQEKTTETRIPAANADGLPQIVKADFERADGKQKSIDSDYESALKQIREAYSKRLGDAAETSTDEELKKKLLAQAARAEDLHAWVKLLAPGDENAAGEQIVMDGTPDTSERVASGPVELGPPPTWLGKATILAWTALPEDFLRFRDDLLEHVKGTENVRFANFATKAACVRPIDDKAVQAEVLKLAQMVFDDGKGEPSFLAMLLGIAQYRCGDFAKALSTLETVDLEWPPVALATNFYEVLCLIQEGGNANLSKAKALFDETESAMPSVPSDDEIQSHGGDRLLMWLAYREAKELLGK